MGKTKGFIYAIQHREILMTDWGLYEISSITAENNELYGR